MNRSEYDDMNTENKLNYIFSKIEYLEGKIEAMLLIIRNLSKDGKC